MCMRFGRPVLPALTDSQAAETPGFEVPFVQVASGELDESVLAAVDDPALAWITAVEPAEWLGPTATRFVTLDTGRGFVRHVVQAVGERMENVAAAPIPIGIAGAHSHTFLSGRHHMVFRLGGGDVLATHHLSAGGQVDISLSEPLGQVQAATLTADRYPDLLVIETTVDEGSERLLKIDLDTGDVIPLAEFQAGDRAHGIAVFPDGRYALAGWSEEELALVIFELGPGNSVVEVGSSSHATQMLGGLTAGPLGVSFLVWDSEADWRPEGILIDELIKDEPAELSSAF